MKILGISGYYHDSAAALVIDGKVVSAQEEERFTGIKHDSSFPKKAIKWILKQNKLKINDIDAIVWYEDPKKKYERFKEQYQTYFPKTIGLTKKLWNWKKNRVESTNMYYYEMGKTRTDGTWNDDKISRTLPLIEYYLNYTEDYNRRIFELINVTSNGKKILIDYTNLGMEAQRKKIKDTAMSVGGFTSVIEYNPEDIDDDFKTKNIGSSSQRD